MNAPAQLRLSEADYLAWEARQPRPHELVGGVVRAMAGGSIAHFAIVRNLTQALHSRLLGGRCQAFPKGIKVRTPAGNYRYPDVLVECGAPRPEDHVAEWPVVLAEIASPSTEWFDETDKLAEYQTLPTARHVLLLSQRRVFGRLWSRADEAAPWVSMDLDGPGAVLDLPAIGISLPLGEVYEGVALPAAPDPEAA